MAAAASTPHHYCFDYSSELMLMNMQFPLLSYEDNNSSVPVVVDSNSADCIVPHIVDFSQLSDHHYTQTHNHNQFFDPGSFMLPCLPYNPNMPAPQDLYWAIQEKAGTKGGEESDQVKVGRYSVEERKDRILRYLKKRNQRNFNKTIKYACRKTLADKRVRVRGRFAKNNEPNSQDEMLINTNDSCYQQINSEMMKYEEDYWLEAAIDNLGQLPYLGS